MTITPTAFEYNREEIYWREIRDKLAISTWKTMQIKIEIMIMVAIIVVINPRKKIKCTQR